MHVDLVVRHGQSYGCATLRGRSATSKFVDPGVAGRGTEDVKVGADQHDSGAEGDSAAIAVSGGVDSMTLAVIAHRETGVEPRRCSTRGLPGSRSRPLT